MVLYNLYKIINMYIYVRIFAAILSMLPGYREYYHSIQSQLMILDWLICIKLVAKIPIVVHAKLIKRPNFAYTYVVGHY